MAKVRPPSIEPSKVPDQRQLPESSVARQEVSKEGGFLRPKERGTWEKFLFIITFQWVVPLFAENAQKKSLVKELSEKFFPNNPSIKTALFQLNYPEIQNFATLLEDNKPTLQNYLRQVSLKDYTTTLQTLLKDPERNNRIFQLFASIDNIVGGRMANEAVYVINFLGQENPEYLEALQNVLNTAFKIEEAKSQDNQIPEEEDARALKEQIEKLQNNTLDPRIKAILQEIKFVVIGEGEPSKGYPFSLQFEKRDVDGNWRMHITDPFTKATRTLTKDAREDILKAVYTLQKPKFPKTVNLALIQEGNVYEIFDGNRARLSLSPRLLDADYAGIDPGLVIHAADIIKNSGTQVMMIPIDTPGGKISFPFEFQSKVEGRQCVITLKHENISYSFNYNLKENETIEGLSERVRDDRTLEKDLLLARSYFANALDKN